MHQRRAGRENGSAYPELDKLMLICDLFHCTLDDLLKGDMKEKNGVSRDAYESHELAKTKGFTASIGIILAGVCTYCFFKPSMGNEDMLNIIFMIFAIIGILILVFYGMQDAAFKRHYPQIPQDIYTEEELDAFHKKFNIVVTVAVGMILFSVLVEQLLEMRLTAYYAYGIFMTLVSAAVLLLVYFGMIKESYNRTTAYTKVSEKNEELIGKWCGCIMMACAAVFLFISFVWDIWNISWIVFPIGGILCGIVSVILSKEEHS